MLLRLLFILAASHIMIGCVESKNHQSSKGVDSLIVNGLVYDGSLSTPRRVNIGICDEKICYVGTARPTANRVIDAQGYIVSPGFIDPHTHTLADLQSDNLNANLNYLKQGVTTVVNGNDGQGLPYVSEMAEGLTRKGVGTNFAFLVGHGAVRKIVMGNNNRLSTKDELNAMKDLVFTAMEQGALGLSTGLYYVPGVYADLSEVIELAKLAQTFGGIYDTHLRDEGSFNIGFLQAINEAISVAKLTGIHLHIAHIKALGVDVWGQSDEAIAIIEDAIEDGVSISADQYPWSASGTNLKSALIPPWALAGSDKQFLDRLSNPNLRRKIVSEIRENIRKRGGGKSILITETKESRWLGKSIAELAREYSVSEEDMVVTVTSKENVRIASFNMSDDDIEAFMVRDWVLTSSDGTNGHPRKFGSYPRKYEVYVKEKKVLNLEQFIYSSSLGVAKMLGLGNRGRIEKGFYADINIIDLQQFNSQATFTNWNRLSSGVFYQFVNGRMTIDKGTFTKALPGQFLVRENHSQY